MECETRRVDEIAKRFELADVYVFGSRAAEIAAHGAGSETAGPADSDVDIGVRMRPGRRLTAADLAPLERERRELILMRGGR